MQALTHQPSFHSLHPATHFAVQVEAGVEYVTQPGLRFIPKEDARPFAPNVRPSTLFDLPVTVVEEAGNRDAVWQFLVRERVARVDALGPLL